MRNRSSIVGLHLLVLLILVFLGFKPVRIDLSCSVYVGTVRVIPGIVNLGLGGAIGREFTVAVVLEEVSNISGFDVNFRWNTTYLDYVNHTVTAYIEEFPDPIPPSPYGGCLHLPKLNLIDHVDTEAGTYQAAMATLGGPTFSGNGTAFIMSFRVKNQIEVEVQVTLEPFGIDLGKTPGDPLIYVYDGIVVIPSIGSGNDIALLNISYPKTIVGEGFSTYFNVSLENQGGSTETFNLTVFADAEIISIIEGISLESLASNATLVPWNTTGWAYGHYTTRAWVTPVPNETDLTDNQLIAGEIFVTIPGDVDADFDVDIYDIVIIAGSYGTSQGQQAFNSNCDIDGDEDVDIYDVVIAAGNYGEEYTP